MHGFRAIPILGALAVIGLALPGCGREAVDPGALPPNLLFITVDTLRPDRLSHAGYWRETSPAIDALAEQGLRFETAYSQSGWTLPSIATLMTGLHPSEHGAFAATERIHTEIPTLASILGQKGYETHAFVSHVMLGRKQGIASGFDAFDDSVLDVGHPHSVSTGRELTELALDALRETDEPFFLWVHYFDPHFSYLPHDAPWGEVRRARYDAEILFTDRQIGRLLDFLSQSGLASRTLVVLTADHGEEFQDHQSNLHYSLYEEDVRVPLIFRGPGIAPGVDSFPAQQIDLTPTILALLGFDAPEGLPGRDLLAHDRSPRPIYMERTRPEPFVQRVVIDGDKKLYSIGVNQEWEGSLEAMIKKTAVKPGVQLFDLAADPKEKNDLFDEHDPESKRMLELLARYIEPETQSDDPRTIDEDLRAKLRSLGYLE